MPTISIDSSDLKRLERDLERIQAQLPQAIARGLNEGGDKVRTQVQRALQKQTSLVKYSSVTSRVRTVRAFAGWTGQGWLRQARELYRHRPTAGRQKSASSRPASPPDRAAA